MEDIAIGATAVIGIVGGIAANVEIPEPADGAQVQVLEIAIMGKVVQIMLTVTVATALVTHVETLVVNAPATTTVVTITTTTMGITKAVRAVDISKAVQLLPLWIVEAATAQIIRAKGVVINAAVAATIPGGTMEEVITMAGDLQIQLMDVPVRIQEIQK